MGKGVKPFICFIIYDHYFLARAYMLRTQYAQFKGRIEGTIHLSMALAFSIFKEDARLAFQEHSQDLLSLLFFLSHRQKVRLYFRDHHQEKFSHAKKNRTALNPHLVSHYQFQHHIFKILEQLICKIGWFIKVFKLFLHFLLIRIVLS